LRADGDSLKTSYCRKNQLILFLNTLDRAFLEQQFDLEEVYHNVRNSVESSIVIAATYKHKNIGDFEISPERGNVGFGSGLHGWGFTLADFAKINACKFSLSEEKLIQKLWGNNYWDRKNEKWV